MPKDYKDVFELRKDFPAFDKCDRAYVVPSKLDKIKTNRKHVKDSCAAHWVIKADRLSELVGQALFIGIETGNSKSSPVREIFGGVISGFPILDGVKYKIPVKYENNGEPLCTVRGNTITSFYGGTGAQSSSLIPIKKWSSNTSLQYTSNPTNEAQLLYDELRKIAENTSIDSTEKIQLILARIGQTEFRANVMERANYSCDVTGFDQPELLMASHILPWISCKTKKQRLDANNGLMLTPTLDRLFDRGFIGFDDRGRMIVRDGFLDNLRELMPSIRFDQHNKLRVEPNPEQVAYLKMHRQKNKLENAPRVRTRNRS